MSHLIQSLEGRRYRAAGTVDPSFGTGVTTLIPTVATALAAVPYPNDLFPSQLLTDSAGRIVTVVSSDGYSTSLTRLTADGRVDPAFAPHAHHQAVVLGNGLLDGSALGPDAADSPLYDIESIGRAAIDPSDGVLVLTRGALTRYTSAGELDRGFGGGTVDLAALGVGRRAGEFGFEGAADFAVDRQGRVWVASRAWGDAAHVTSVTEVDVLNASGDSSGGAVKSFFGTGYYVVPRPGPGSARDRSAAARALRLLDDGSVVVAADATMIAPGQPATGRLTSSGVEVVKFTAAGTLDPAYGDGGLTVYRLTETEESAHPGHGNGLSAGFLTQNADGSVVLTTTRDVDPVRTLDATGRRTHASPLFDVTAANPVGVPVGLDPLVTEADGSRWVLDLIGHYGTQLLSGHLYRLYHLRSDGTADPGFNGGQPVQNVTAAAVANDGSILYARGGGDSADNDPHPARYTDAFGTASGPDGSPLPTIGRLFADEGPVAQYAGGVLAKPVKDTVFSLLWRDDDGVNASTLDDQDVYLRAHGFTARGRVISRTAQSDGRVRVTYAARGPDGAWMAANDGAYTLAVRPGSVADTGGHFAAAQSIGVLTVAIA